MHHHHLWVVVVVVEDDEDAPKDVLIEGLRHQSVNNWGHQKTEHRKVHFIQGSHSDTVLLH